MVQKAERVLLWLGKLSDVLKPIYWPLEAAGAQIPRSAEGKVSNLLSKPKIRIKGIIKTKTKPKHYNQTSASHQDRKWPLKTQQRTCFLLAYFRPSNRTAAGKPPPSIVTLCNTEHMTYERKTSSRLYTKYLNSNSIFIDIFSKSIQPTYLNSPSTHH